MNFSVDGDYLISVGAEDRCAFQWKRDAEEKSEKGKAPQVPELHPEVANETSVQLSSVPTSTEEKLPPGNVKVCLHRKTENVLWRQRLIFLLYIYNTDRST